MLRWFVNRGERLIKLRYSWFSTKTILVGHWYNKNLENGKALNNIWGAYALLKLLKLGM